MSNPQKREPLMRVVKKDGATMGEKIWARAAAILLALVLDALFIFFVTGVFGLRRDVQGNLRNLDPLFVGDA